MAKKGGAMPFPMGTKGAKPVAGGAKPQAGGRKPQAGGRKPSKSGGY